MFHLIAEVQDFLWTYVILALLICAALYFTIRLGFVQFVRIGHVMRSFRDKQPGDAEEERHTVNSFQAFAIGLSSRVGTGNLAGVASAIAVGGPGAVFWMWMTAILGAATAFVEATLAQLFKRNGEDSFYGGPAYYIQYGMHCPWLGVLFAVCLTFTFGMANQVVQSNTLCDALGTAWGYDTRLLAVVIMAMAMVIIYGGIHRISRFAAIMVPIMALGYLFLTMYVLVAHYREIPRMMSLIVEHAFGIRQMAGGAMGTAILQGVKRGLFSNEAGEGSAPNAAATATTSHPVKQGLLQAFGVFVDTLVVCTCTAFVILLSGLYYNGEDGILLTGTAMNYFFGSWGRLFLTACIFMFAFTTIIANYFYGETNIHFISQKRWVIATFRVITAGTILLGGFISLQEAFSVADLAMATLVIINVTAILWLSPYVVRLYNDYMRQYRQGQDPTFDPSTMPDIRQELEAWEEPTKR